MNDTLQTQLTLTPERTSSHEVRLTCQPDASYLLALTGRQVLLPHSPTFVDCQRFADARSRTSIIALSPAFMLHTTITLHEHVSHVVVVCAPTSSPDPRRHALSQPLPSRPPPLPSPPLAPDAFGRPLLVRSCPAAFMASVARLHHATSVRSLERVTRESKFLSWLILHRHRPPSFFAISFVPPFRSRQFFPYSALVVFHYWFFDLAFLTVAHNARLGQEHG